MNHGKTADAGLTTADAWRGSELAASGAWQYTLERADLDELVAAAAHACATGKPRLDWTAADFPVGLFAQRIDAWLTEIEYGRGFVLIRGLPVDQLGVEASADLYWGIGLHLGTPVSQNTDGDRLGHVLDLGADPFERGVRLYKTRAEQDFHTDGADLIGLLCLTAARTGGVSRIVSSVTVYNELLRLRPDLAPVLFEPFPFDKQGQEAPGQPSWFDFPICRFEAGRLCTFFIPWYIRESQDNPQAPRLTRAQIECVGLLEAIANQPELGLDMAFRPGDIQFLRNASILHKRTAYEDWPEPARKRHLLRLWISRAGFSAGDPMLRRGIRARSVGHNA